MHAVEEPVRRMGLETWFTLPGLPAPAKAPPGWKMALVTWLALLPQVIALGFIIPASWPMLAGAVVGTVIPVSMLQWVVMPRLTRLLYGWLYAADPSVARSLPAAPSAGRSSAS
jgi:antibiotic biosynthesis monooxygenase (ABM) superfamily enzyme